MKLKYKICNEIGVCELQIIYIKNWNHSCQEEQYM